MIYKLIYKYIEVPSDEEGQESSFIPEEPQIPVEGDVFYFNVGPYVYIEGNPKPVKGSYEYYVPTTEEQETMAKEYENFVSQFPEGRKNGIEAYLNPDDLQAYKDVLWGDYEALMETFDLTGLNKIMHFTSSLGFRCNGDRRTLENIRGLHDILQDDETTVPYRDYDNQSHDLTKPQLATLMMELQQNGLNLYTQKWARQAEVESAETLEQLRAVNFNVEWKDFSTGGVEQPSGSGTAAASVDPFLSFLGD